MALIKWGFFFFLKARHVVNKVLLISLFQRRHGIKQNGAFFVLKARLVKKWGWVHPPISRATRA